MDQYTNGYTQNHQSSPKIRRDSAKKKVRSKSKSKKDRQRVADSYESAGITSQDAGVDIDEMRDRLEYERFIAGQYKFENKKLKESNEQLTNGLRDNEKIIKQMKMITNMLKKNERIADEEQQNQNPGGQRSGDLLQITSLQQQLDEKKAQYDALKRVMLDEENSKSKAMAER